LRGELLDREWFGQKRHSGIKDTVVGPRRFLFQDSPPRLKTRRSVSPPSAAGDMATALPAPQRPAVGSYPLI
jgi:hypothetical protein